MKARVLGYGRSGKAAEALLKGLGYEVEVWQEAEGDSARRDRSVASPDADAPNGDAALLPHTISFAVVSPGIPLTHPWIAACRAHGIPLKSELQLGCEALKRRGWKLLAVTGSKGKSSVVKIVADAITKAGGCGVACGNYGVPVCEVAMREPLDGIGGEAARPQCRWAVVEVSSFMMETTELPSDTFEAAAILNLQEDHLDRHGSVEVYHGLKRKLLTMAKDAVGQEAIRAAQPPRPLRLLAGSYFDNPVLRGNGVCAVALMRVAGLDDEAIARAFRTFEPLPHRMNLVAEIGGVRYIDDSKATSLAALAAGVEMAGAGAVDGSFSRDTPVASPLVVRLIAGGLPKGDDPKSVLPTLTTRVRKVYLIGQCAEQFRSAWSLSVDCEVCGAMDKAVGAAMHDAVKGETVLLSPGAASFDQFESFGQRGDVFAALVKKGKTE